MTMILRRAILRRYTRSICCTIAAAALMWMTLAPTDAATDDENYFTHLHTEKAMANVTVSPGRAGPVDITIQLETTDERPLSAKAVAVTLADMQTGKRLQPIEASRRSDDEWHVRISMLTPGRWMLGLGISISGADHVDVESPILIR
jgi:copper transport protein